MEGLFWNLANLTVSGSIAIAGVLVFRLILKDQAKIFSYLLWIIVGIRLLVPISFGGVWGAIPFSEQGWEMLYDALESSGSDSSLTQENGISSVGMHMVSSGNVENVVSSRDISGGSLMENSAMTYILLVWGIGVIGMVVKNIIAYLRLKRKVRVCMKEGEYYLCDAISGAFVLGIFRPRIYMSSRLSEEERRYIYSHERVHLKRRDDLWKGLAECILCLHWFNPLVWIAYRKFTADMEMSCDEAVLRREGQSVRAVYARVLLAEMAESRDECLVPFFRRGGTERRIHNMMMKKIWNRKRIGICAGVVVTAALLLIPGFWGEETFGKETFGKETAGKQRADSVKKTSEKENIGKGMEVGYPTRVYTYTVQDETPADTADEKLTTSYVVSSEGDYKQGYQVSAKEASVDSDSVSEAVDLVDGSILSVCGEKSFITDEELVIRDSTEKEKGCDLVITADVKMALDGKGKYKTYKNMKWYLTEGKDGQWKIKDADIYHLE